MEQTVTVFKGETSFRGRMILDCPQSKILFPLLCKLVVDRVMNWDMRICGWLAVNIFVRGLRLVTLKEINESVLLLRVAWYAKSSQKKTEVTVSMSHRNCNKNSSFISNGGKDCSSAMRPSSLGLHSHSMANFLVDFTERRGAEGSLSPSNCWGGPFKLRLTCDSDLKEKNEKGQHWLVF